MGFALSYKDRELIINQKLKGTPLTHIRIPLLVEYGVDSKTTVLKDWPPIMQTVDLVRLSVQKKYIGVVYG